jgi:hypothetical protein
MAAKPPFIPGTYRIAGRDLETSSAPSRVLGDSLVSFVMNLRLHGGHRLELSLRSAETGVNPFPPDAR